MNSAYAASNLNTSRTFQPHPRDPRVNQITFQLNRKPPETLDLEKDDKISGSKLHKWMEQMENCLKLDPNINVLQYMTVNARDYLGIRFRLRDDSVDKTNTADWDRKWNADTLFKAIHIVWPKGMENFTEYTLEAKLRQAKPKIKFESALEDSNAWAAIIFRAVSDDQSVHGAALPGERQQQLVKILMGHLQGEGVQSFLRFEIEKGGRPATVQDFLDKLMVAAEQVQKSNYTLGMCGMRAIMKRKPSEEDALEGGAQVHK
jgi:hypothetical protein